tara:strand:- start:3427 stop:4101 length:675 start_codon:yes stop_codon:yes gene_type:complete
MTDELLPEESLLTYNDILNYQPIKHHCGVNWKSPNLGSLSEVLAKSTSWMKHQIEIKKRNFKDTNEIDFEKGKKITSDESLRKLVKTEFNNKPLEKNVNNLYYVMPTVPDIKQEICNSFRYLREDIIQSGNFLYKPGGYMGWHTNYKRPGLRVYIVYSLDGGSEFKYSVCGSNEIHTIVEKPGWNINIFRVDIPPSYIWHSVRNTDTWRASLGFRINDKHLWGY